MTYLDSDDSCDFPGDGHAPVSPAASLHGDGLFGDVGAVLGVFDHRLRLAVLVHGDGDHLLGLLQLTSQRLDAHRQRAHLVGQLDAHAVVVFGLHADLSQRALQLPVVRRQLAATALLHLKLRLQVTQLQTQSTAAALGTDDDVIEWQWYFACMYGSHFC